MMTSEVWGGRQDAGTAPLNRELALARLAVGKVVMGGADPD